MEYSRLGNSGLKISRVIFGCMSLGSSEWQKWVLDEDAALPLLKHAYDVGLNTWDTADIYSHGRSEEIIGKALREYKIPRNQVVILSKCYFGVNPDGKQLPVSLSNYNDRELVNQVGLSRKHILDAVDQSVARLGTYIDVLQIHRLDRGTPREEIMRALNDVVESGKVRYIGASSVNQPCMNTAMRGSRDIDGCMGVPGSPECCGEKRLAQICVNAELLQPDLSRGRCVHPYGQLITREEN
jgi:aryl-alcohol dehydrogenase-like predicted oxidoreductase